MPVSPTQEVSTYLNAAVSADVDAAVAAATGLRLMGYTVRETAAAVASAKIVNGATGAAAGKVAEIGLVASGGQAIWFGPLGIPCPLGISINRIAGTMGVVIYYRTEA